MKILVVEDDRLVADALDAVLSSQNYAVEVASDGEVAWDLIQVFDYDVIILDVILPKIDGISLCRQIRSQGLRMPILLLTGCDSSHDKAIGLDAGADDYLVKPFDQEELVARIRALLRRGSLTSQPILEWDHLRLDPTSCEVTYNEEQLSLTPKEYALLELFLRNSRRVFSCGMILEHLWSYEDTPGEEAVRTHVKGLRMKLKAMGAPGDLIETVYGIGYRLKPQDELSQKKTLPGREHKAHNSLQGVGKTAVTPATSWKQQTLAAIASIWSRYEDRVNQQVSVLESASEAARHKTLRSQLRKQAQAEAHSLGGSLGTFGLALGSELGKKIEQQLKITRTWKAEEITQFGNWVKQLRREIERHQETLAALPPAEDHHPLLLIVDSDRTLAEEIAQASTTQGIKVTIADSIETARSKLYREHPNVVLLDPDVSPSHEDSFNLLWELRSRKPPVPAIVFTAESDFSNRLQVVRNGGHTFLQKPLDVPQVLAAVNQIWQNAPHGEAHILVVDDDPQIGAVLHTLLQPWGIKVTKLRNPQRFWQTLETVAPDLLILDVEMPAVSGLELCQVVRNDPQWSDLPILFLTVHQDPNIINQVFSVGADDFVSKPIVGPELVTRIINRLERIKLRQRVTQSQPLKSSGDVASNLSFQQIEAKLKARIEQQAAVAKLGESALLGTKLEDLINQAVVMVAENLEVEYCQLLELLPAGNTMLLRAGVGWREGLVGKATIDLDDTGASYTLSVQKPVIVANLPTETRFAGSLLLREHGIISGVTVPIAKRNGSYGVLGVYSSQQRTFTQSDINFIQSIANVLSAAMESQDTQQALRQAKTELEQRVIERTAELEKTNQQLQSELNERQRAQEELRHSQARFAGIVEIADDAIISIDNQQKITLFNQGAEKIFGYSAQEVMGKSLDLLLPSRYTAAHRQYVNEFGKSAKVARPMGERREIFGLRKDGTEFPAEASISKLDLGGEIIYTVYLQDISDRKYIERMKDEFVSVTSHELRTPLTSIHGSLGMLASGMIPPDSEQGKRLLQIAVDSTERLVRLINDILDIERIESGKVKMEKQTCNVSDLITEAVNVIQPLADKAGVNLDIQSISAHVWADFDRVVQTLTNLLSNAIKFSHRDATVWLTAQLQQVDSENNSHYQSQVLLQVEDTGRGIPADKLDNIFERFQQVDSSDSRHHDGTGLGLAICKSIVQQHGGNIWVESVLGEGSTFSFTLPCSASPTPVPSPKGISDLTDKHSPLVLICDDDPQILQELQTLLEKQNYRVLVADSGEVAIQIASNQHPDAILLDLLMPGMNGWEVMAVLKERPDTQDIPIIICSVCQPTSDNQPSSDFVDWVSKPLEASLLFNSLRQAIAPSSRRVRILVVEDDPETAEILTTVLESHDIETSLASTGREAIHLSQAVNPDLMILDIGLPEGDGFDVVEWLQQHNQLYNIPLVVYSGKDLDDSERNRLKLGRTEFLTKGRVTTQKFEQHVLGLIQRITQTREQGDINDN
ncbi:MAG: response regulator [Calothrix sp. MO_192.B10]|nr:response regulator [Calothrix sp. MO_192.B10]